MGLSFDDSTKPSNISAYDGREEPDAPNEASGHKYELCVARCYAMIVETRPSPTVWPPSRMEVMSLFSSDVFT